MGTMHVSTHKPLGRRRRMMAVAAAVSGLLVLGAASAAAAAAPAGATVGGTCTVTSGANKGKTGTYTVDEDGNMWCEGKWGGTQCATRCKNGVVARMVAF